VKRPGEVDPQLRAAALEAFMLEKPEPSITYVEADRRLTAALAATMGRLRERAGLAERPDDLPDPPSTQPIG
jgi:hypothetical protein